MCLDRASFAYLSQDSEKDNKSRVKRTHLGFEDFLEAICRVACLKALPTDGELEDAECDNAGTYLIRLRAERLDSYDTPTSYFL